MRKNRTREITPGGKSQITGNTEYLSLFMLMVFLLIGCGDKDLPKKPLNTTGKVNQGDLNTIECKGTIEAKYHFTRYLQKDEKIASFAVSEGAEVKKGDLLVILSNLTVLKEYTELSYRKLRYNEKKNKRKILDLEIAKTSRELSNLKKELEEEKKLNKRLKDYPYEIQVQRINKKIKSLNDELEILEKKSDFLKSSIDEEGKVISFLDSQLTQVNRRLKGMEIRAPFGGIVNFVASSGESLHPGDLVIEVLDQNELYVRAQVWQHQLQYIEAGSDVYVFPDFFGEYFFKGKVRRISSSYIKGTRDEYPKFSIYINMDSNIKKIKAGMSVTVKIKRSE